MSSPTPKYSNWVHKSNLTSPSSPFPANGFGTNESDPQKHIYMETTGVANYSFHEQATIERSSAISPNHLVAPSPLHDHQHEQQPSHQLPNGLVSYFNINNIQVDLRQSQQHANEMQQPPSSGGPEQVDHGHVVELDEQQREFLPLCDLLFNIISLAAYFCDVVFDIVTVYTLYISDRDRFWYKPTLFFIVCSSIISQVLSLKWFTRRDLDVKKKVNWTSTGMICVIFTHIFQCGILWRYFRLFVPVNLMTVKLEVRDLCMLRMVHAFCEAAPMLLIQFYLLWIKPYPEEITDLNVISTMLSLFSLCWALASFSKNARRQNIHKLVLTWLGVIFQFFWRIGTVGSRVVALTVYATVYHHWIFLVIFLHWISMLLWLLSPKHLFHRDRISFSKRILYTVLVSWVYVLSYINLHESNTRRKMMAFYTVMFVENTLLLGVCLLGYPSGSGPWFQEIAALLVWGGFLIGLVSMILYYKFFHIRYLKHTLLASHYDDYPGNQCPEHGIRANMGLTSSLGPCITANSTANGMKPLGLSGSGNAMMSSIPGVFNCRLNPALKRKKKKPSTFVPPPAHISSLSGQTSSTNANLVALLAAQNGALSKSPISAINGGLALPSTGGPPLGVPHAVNSIKSPRSISREKGPHYSSSSITAPTALPTTSPILVSNGRASVGPAVSRMSAASPLNSTMNQATSNSFNQNNLASGMVRMTPVDFSLNGMFDESRKFTNNNRVSSPRTIGQSDSDNVSGGSHVNIQQKLHEKRLQQLMQLREIEEEMKEGKLHPFDNGNNQLCNVANERAPPLLPRSFPPPQAKRQPWLSQRPEPVAFANSRSTPRLQRQLNNGLLPHCYYHPGFRKMKIRSHTPEVLLSPHYLEKSRVYYDYPPGVLPPSIPGFLTPHVGFPIENGSSEDDGPRYRTTVQRAAHHLPMSIRGHRLSKVKLSQSRPDLVKPIPITPAALAGQSDMDSQASLPRSYTLPGQFRYYRGNVYVSTKSRSGVRKAIRVENFSSNNNSSDGDVDSDINEAEANHSSSSATMHNREQGATLLSSPTQLQHQPLTSTCQSGPAAPPIRPRTMYASQNFVQVQAKDETPL
ncbi:XK-related protein 6 [Halotydeus destructor]|nr:XK-related protein 6 [Halotydeus destructor]